MNKGAGCGGAARRQALRVQAVLFLAAGALVPPGGPAAAAESRDDEFLSRAGARPAVADCTLAPSHFDPDGRVRRESVSGVTRAFAVSHPAATGSTFHPVLHIRRVNYVDDEIFGKMEADKVVSAPLSSDTEFLRRVTLDLTGRIPDADVVVAFVADPSPDKRSRMVDTLLASEAFVDRWAFYYDELFQNTARSATGTLWYAANTAYHGRLFASVRAALSHGWDA